MPKIEMRIKKRVYKITSIVLGVIGVVLLGSVVVPIVSYEYQSRKQFPMLLNPLSDKTTFSVNSVSAADLTKASNWFPGSVKDNYEKPQIKFFNLSVPKLDIENATVEIGGENLDEHLIQFPGTALPGEIGNTVIFGHSILPVYYNPKNYLSIFSTLPTLKQKDKIIVHYDGVTYTYEVIDKFEVLPTELSVLDQMTDGSYLSLITCTPPGHPQKPKRLVVRAKLVPYQRS